MAEAERADALAVRVTDAEARAEFLARRLEAAETAERQCVSARAECAALRSQLGAAEEREEAAAAVADAGAVAVAEARAARSDAQVAMRDKARLESTVERLEAELAAARAELAVGQDRLSEQQGALDAAEGRVARAEARASSVRDLQRACAAVTRERDEAREALAEARVDIVSAKEARKERAGLLVAVKEANERAAGAEQVMTKLIEGGLGGATARGGTVAVVDTERTDTAAVQAAAAVRMEVKHRADALEAKLNAAERRHDNQFAQLGAAVRTARSDFASSASASSAAAERVAQLEATLRDEMRGRDASLAALSDAVASARNLASTGARSAAGASASAAEAASERTAALEARLVGELQKRDAAIGALTSAVQSVRAVTAAGGSERASVEALETRLTNEVRRQAGVIAQLQQSLAEASARVNPTELASQATAIARLQGQLASRDAQIASLARSVEQLMVTVATPPARHMPRAAESPATSLPDANVAHSPVPALDAALDPKARSEPVDAAVTHEAHTPRHASPPEPASGGAAPGMSTPRASMAPPSESPARSTGSRFGVFRQRAGVKAEKAQQRHSAGEAAATGSPACARVVGEAAATALMASPGGVLSRTGRSLFAPSPVTPTKASSPAAAASGAGPSAPASLRTPSASGPVRAPVDPQLVRAPPANFGAKRIRSPAR